MGRAGQEQRYPLPDAGGVYVIAKVMSARGQRRCLDAQLADWHGRAARAMGRVADAVGGDRDLVKVVQDQFDKAFSRDPADEKAPKPGPTGVDATLETLEVGALGYELDTLVEESFVGFHEDAEEKVYADVGPTDAADKLDADTYAFVQRVCAWVNRPRPKAQGSS